MTGTKILEINKLKKDFILPLTRKHVKALDDLSFSVSEGGIVGFLGANGAGKTTTLKIIFQLIFPDSGDVKIFGKSNHDSSIKETVGFLTERPYFYDYLTGREFLRFTADLFQNEKAHLRIEPLLEEVGLKHAADRPLRRYSKGMLQRIGIAQALVNDPKLLILDEPMSGLDPDGRAEICKIIKACHEKGTTILFSTHLLPDVENLCDRVIIIDHGKLIIEDSVSDLLERQAKGFLLEFEKGGKSPVQNMFTTSDELQKGIDQVRNSGGRIIRVETVRPSLEEVFLALQRASR